jgi:ABC-type spermidine/putrescine transport system permease subunit II
VTVMTLRPSLTTVLFAAAVLVFLILPNLVIVMLSFSPSEYFQFPPPSLSLRWYERFFEDPRWTDAFLRSVRIGVFVALLATTLGVAAAFALVRGKMPAAQLVAGLLLSPLVVPHVVLAAGLFVLFVSLGLLQTEAGLVVAHTLIATPIVIMTVMVSMRGLRRELEFAAMSLGAGYALTLWRVVLPQLRQGILTGALLAFVSSFDETTLSIFLGGVGSTTLPIKMWDGITVESNPVLPAASTIVLVCSTFPVVALDIWRRLRDSRRKTVT